MRNSKHHIVFIANEEQRINELLEREDISTRARVQLKLIRMLGKGGIIVEAAEIHGISYQTVGKWKKAFNRDRLESLLVFLEDKKDNEIVLKGKL